MTSIMLPPPGAASNDPKLAAQPPPKKKRKRAGTGGANNDCFTCNTRGVKCDRKRPYCTQCLDIGKECSGYKTTLTWGVGVASRGKLRGLSCPIASKSADGSSGGSDDREARRRRKSSTSQHKNEAADKSATALKQPSDVRQEAATAFVPNNAYPQSFPPQIQQNHLGWQSHDFQNNIFARRVDGVRDPRFSLNPLQPIQTHLDSPVDGSNAPKSGRSMSAYSETPFYSPMEFPHTPGSLPYPETLMQSSFPEQSHATHSIADSSMSASSADSYRNGSQFGLSSGELGTSLQSNGSTSHPAAFVPYVEVFDGSSEQVLTPISNMTVNPMNSDIVLEEEDLVDEPQDMAIFDPRFSSPFFQFTPRMQTLMNYYERNICPYLVAFDGSENPYRKHILQLAVRNEGLQHAIAALATNNHRMRTKELQQIGFIEDIGALGESTTDLSSGPSQEESLYKQLSINELNMQLADPGAAQDDSVLATLLILCLFHVCDSGFSKFKTQLAGVQKLLSLRHPNTQSDFTRWVQMFFSWFDVMTSTVNDREVQVQGESLSMLDFNANLGAMEQFSGCDGRLFKLIARLGRLNLLAQGRPVRHQSYGSGGLQTPRPFPQSRMNSWWRKPPTSFNRIASLNPADYENIDGNGWGTPIITSDDDAEGSATDSGPDETHPRPDPRMDFWTEWNDTRTRLEEWSMPSPLTDSTTSQTPEQTDLYHINESFRHAALLYLTRLAHPLLPSSHELFQHQVSTALLHITSLEITSCVNKFLLWPLFIIGTECVDETHRDIVRTRCRDVAEESGFYNNMSSLAVLEKVWKEVGKNVRGAEAEEVVKRRRDSEVSSLRPGRYGQAFRWRKAMDRVDGEYIVI